MVFELKYGLINNPHLFWPIHFFSTLLFFDFLCSALAICSLPELSSSLSYPVHWSWNWLALTDSPTIFLWWQRELSGPFWSGLTIHLKQKLVADLLWTLQHAHIAIFCFKSWSLIPSKMWSITLFEVMLLWNQPQFPSTPVSSLKVLWISLVCFHIRWNHDSTACCLINMMSCGIHLTSYYRTHPHFLVDFASLWSDCFTWLVD